MRSLRREPLTGNECGRASGTPLNKHGYPCGDTHLNPHPGRYLIPPWIGKDGIVYSEIAVTSNPERVTLEVNDRPLLVVPCPGPVLIDGRDGDAVFDLLERAINGSFHGPGHLPPREYTSVVVHRSSPSLITADVCAKPFGYIQIR